MSANSANLVVRQAIFEGFLKEDNPSKLIWRTTNDLKLLNLSKT